MASLRVLSRVMLCCVALSACQEPAAPAGTPGSVTVQAYIDRDGSGTFTAADSSLAGFPVTLIGPTSTLTATTDASGRATFDALLPGSYRIEPSGDVTGAVLSSAPAAQAVVGFRGGADTVDVRFAFYPGIISGRIFRDDNGNGTYDAGTDTPGAGLYVLLHSGGTTIDSTTADATGAYGFSRIAPGDYTLQFEQPTTIDYGASGATRPISVVPATTVDESGIFTGSLLIPIASARQRPVGAAVSVSGRIIVAPNTFTSGSGGVNSEIWVQDSTGGIAVFSVPSTSTLALGDSVEVSGTLGAFGGQLQIGSSPIVTMLGSGAPVTPTALTVAEANQLGANEGLLVAIPGVRIVSVPGGTGAAFTVKGVDAAGDTLQIRVAAAATGLTRSSFTVGEQYTITGVLTQFNGTAQVKPRSPEDVAGPSTIGAVRTMELGTAVSVSGTITAPPGVFTSGTGGVNSEIWVQDATGGIAIFSVPTSSTLQLGDRVGVSGTLGAFNDQLQLTSPAVTLIESGSAPAPLAMTGTQVNALANEGMLVTLPLTITSVPTGTGGAFTVIGTAADGQSVQIRVAGTSTGLTRSSFTVGATQTVTGILTQFRGTAQIKPRFSTDVTP